MRQLIICSNRDTECLQNLRYAPGKEDKTKIIILTEGEKETDKKKWASIMSVNKRANIQLLNVQCSPVLKKNRRIEIENMSKELVMAIDEKSDIVANISNMSPDMVIGVFVALEFATEVCGCKVKNIVYGEECDLAPLFYMNEIKKYFTELETEKAKKIFAGL